MIIALVRMIEHMGDPDYQERIWVNGVGPECDSFDETVCWFFSIFRGFRDFKEPYEECGLSKRQVALLRELYHKFDQYLDVAPQTNEEVVEDPQWHEVSACARKIYPELMIDE